MSLASLFTLSLPLSPCTENVLLHTIYTLYAVQLWGSLRCMSPSVAKGQMEKVSLWMGLAKTIKPHQIILSSDVTVLNFNSILTIDFFVIQSNCEWWFNECKIGSHVISWDDRCEGLHWSKVSPYESHLLKFSLIFFFLLNFLLTILCLFFLFQRKIEENEKGPFLYFAFLPEIKKEISQGTLVLCFYPKDNTD